MSFKDKDRKNLKPENIVVSKKGRGSAHRRIAQIDDRIRELNAEKESLLKSLS